MITELEDEILKLLKDGYKYDFKKLKSDEVIKISTYPDKKLYYLHINTCYKADELTFEELTNVTNLLKNKGFKPMHIIGTDEGIIITFT
jgi:hypothetical protein